MTARTSRPLFVLLLAIACEPKSSSTSPEPITRTVGGKSFEFFANEAPMVHEIEDAERSLDESYDRCEFYSHQVEDKPLSANVLVWADALRDEACAERTEVVADPGPSAKELENYVVEAVHAAVSDNLEANEYEARRSALYRRPPIADGRDACVAAWKTFWTTVCDASRCIEQGAGRYPGENEALGMSKERFEEEYAAGCRATCFEGGRRNASMHVMQVPIGELVMKDACDAAVRAKKTAWWEMGVWKGSGTKTTQRFEITGSKWRLKHKNAGGGVLQVMVHRGSRMVALAANTTRAGSEESVFRTKGTHHLLVNAANTDWEVTVEQLLTPKQAAKRIDTLYSSKEARPFVPVGTWSGNGAKTTDDFEVTTKEWKIEHENDGGGVLQIMVYRDGKLDTMVANTSKAGKDTSWVYEQGTFHLVINSANTNWSVRALVQDP